MLGRNHKLPLGIANEVLRVDMGGFDLLITKSVDRRVREEQSSVTLCCGCGEIALWGGFRHIL